MAAYQYFPTNNWMPSNFFDDALVFAESKPVSLPLLMQSFICTLNLIITTVRIVLVGRTPINKNNSVLVPKNLGRTLIQKNFAFCNIFNYSNKLLKII